MRVYMKTEDLYLKKGKMLVLRPNALAGVWIALMEDGEILDQMYASSFRRAKFIFKKFLK